MMKFRQRFVPGVSLLLLMLTLAACGMTPATGDTAPTQTGGAATAEQTTAAVETPAPATAAATTDVPTTTTAPAQTTDTPAATTETDVTAMPATVTALVTAEADSATVTAVGTDPSPLGTMIAGITTGPVEDPPTLWVRNGPRLTPVNYEVAPGVNATALQVGSEEFGSATVSIAPDGSYIAYTINEPGKMGLVLVDTRTRAESFVTGVNWGAAFSPDSRSVAYTISDMTSAQLVIQNIESGETRVILEGDVEEVYRPIVWTASGLFLERIIPNSDAPPQGLFKINPDGGSIQPLREGSHLNAAITGDGGKAALVIGHIGMGTPSEAGLVIQNSNAGDERIVVEQSTGLIPHLDWSPGGSKLVYSTVGDFESPVRTLHILNADGSAVQTINLDETGTTGSLRDAMWSDDDTLLLLIGEAGGELRLYAFSGGSNLKSIGSFGTLSQGQSAQIVSPTR